MLKVQYAPHISVSVIDNNIFIFNEIDNSIKCIVDKMEKEFCIHLANCLFNEFDIDGSFVSDSQKKVIDKLCQKGYLVVTEV